MGNTFGRAFRVTTWGESHGDAVGVTVDGCPPGMPLSVEAIQAELNRRRPGQSDISTQRREADEATVLSGVFEGLTLGTPISICVWNRDARGKDYDYMRRIFRPSHADYTYQAKYGIRNWKGGGRASARETVGRVAAGAIAKLFLASEYGVEIVGYVKSVQHLRADVDPETVRQEDVEANAARCPDEDVAVQMIERIKQARKAGDSLGGVVEAVARRVPPGLGEPVFDKLDADLAKAMLSLPACKGFEVGSGFGGTTSTGSQHNDPFYSEGGRIRTRTNNSGGNPGRHIERRERHRARGVQADGDDRERAGHGGRGRRARNDAGQGTPRPRACCRAPCESWRRCWQSCSRTTPSANAASGAKWSWVDTGSNVGYRVIQAQSPTTGHAYTLGPFRAPLF